MSSSDSGESTMVAMVIVCTVAFGVLGLLYAILWYRGLDKHQDFVARDDDENESQGTEPVEELVRPPKFTDHKEVVIGRARERQWGEPVYDHWLIGGTVSLWVLMWMGATIVLILSLVDRSKYNDASLDDFVSLGPRGCIIENATSYTTMNKKLDALNTVCVEEWEYQVLMIEQGETFTSSPLSLEKCRATCEQCRSRLFGPDYYAGVDHKTRGNYLAPNETTFAECWAPTIPVDELSDFYSCQSGTGTCFLLRDTAALLQERSKSLQISLIVVYACYAGGALLLLVAAGFQWRNQQVIAQDLKELEGEEEMQDSAPSNPVEEVETKVLATENLGEGGVSSAEGKLAAEDSQAPIATKGD